VQKAEPTSQVRRYLVDNGQLDSKSRGLHFRRSPKLEDKARSLKPCEFGSYINAAPHGDNWVKLRPGVYLPTHLGGAAVLVQVWWDEDGEDEDLVATSPQKMHDDSNVLGNLLNRLENAESPEKRSPQKHTEDPKMVRKRDDMEAFEVDGLEPGTGALYKVVRDKAIIRSHPAVDAKLRNYKQRGDTIELFEWDSTRKWRRCYDADIRITGWMMLDHPDFGALLRPVGFEEVVMFFSPVCAAILENHVDNLTEFIAEGMVVNALAEGGVSPLALAADRGRLDCCVYLLQAHASVDLSAIAAGPAKVLIQALSGNTGDFDMAEFDQAIETLSPRAQVIADRLFDEASAALCPKDEPTPAAGPTTFVSEASLADAFSSSPSAAGPSHVSGAGYENEAPVATAQQGEEYEVNHDAVWIRLGPHVDGAKVGMRTRGQVVTMFEYDATRKWRRVETGGSHNLAKELCEPVGSGWMLISHPKLGDLLSPVIKSEAE